MDTKEVLTNVSTEAVDQITEPDLASKATTGLVIGGVLAICALATYGAVDLASRYIFKKTSGKLKDKFHKKSDSDNEFVEDVESED